MREGDEERRGRTDREREREGEGEREKSRESIKGEKQWSSKAG